MLTLNSHNRVEIQGYRELLLKISYVVGQKKTPVKLLENVIGSSHCTLFLVLFN